VQKGTMLKVALVGCGKVADSHAAQLLRISGCEIVGVCDREPLMAKQLAERFSVRACFSDLADLLAACRPDVVHITTPPASHFGLAKLCLESGCHVYVEKPYTLNERDARALIDLAIHRDLKITAGHDDQFSHVALRMRKLLQDGFLGGPPVHMESYYCYELGKSAYANAFIVDKTHWVRALPGKLLQNIISHGIARIAEYLVSDQPLVLVHGFRSSLLEKIGENEIIDELRVIVADRGGPTAYFTFSSQMRPPLHQFRIYGPENGLILDQDQETLIRLRGKQRKSYLEKFVSPLVLAKQYRRNVGGNLALFLNRDFQMKSGMKNLIDRFYRSIAEDGAPPIPYREIILTARIMDAIFDRLAVSSESHGSSRDRPETCVINA
jgi:predicted dehydrogenase